MKTGIKTTTCYRCACRCGIRVHLKDGEIHYIDGNPEHPLNKGVICAKGANGIMKQKSPARLTRPLRRTAGAQRGAGEFEPISWDEAFDILEKRLAQSRTTDPKKFALFTCRDQMQALAGLSARNIAQTHSNGKGWSVGGTRRANSVPCLGVGQLRHWRGAAGGRRLPHSIAGIRAAPSCIALHGGAIGALNWLN